MLLDDCYRLLDLDPRVSDDEVKSAHRDLMKVWHPDRFGHDPSLRRRAEEKLKAINDAYDTIRDARGAGWRDSGAAREERPADKNPHLRDRLRSYRMWATTCALFAIFFLLRRPTPGGLVLALILFAAAVVLFLRMRALPRD